MTITLPQLRPHPEWRSDEYGDDIVLVVDPGFDVSEVKVTYTATAQGYGEVFEGLPIVIPVGAGTTDNRATVRGFARALLAGQRW